MVLAEDFRDHLISLKLSKTTVDRYTYYCQKFEGFLANNNGEINQAVVESFIRRWNNSGARAFLKEFTYYHNLNINIPRIRGAVERRQKTYISPEEINALGKILLRKHEDKKYYFMLMLSYFGALRRKEVCSIQAIDFQWEVWKKDKAEPLVLKINVEGAKRKKERNILIPPKLAQLLWEWIHQHQDQLVVSDKPMFGLSPDSWDEVFRRACAVLKRKYTLHELRFSRATYWHQVCGFDIVTIKKLLGHTDIATTQRYIDPDVTAALLKLRETMMG